MPRKGDYHGTSDVDYYRKRIGMSFMLTYTSDIDVCM